MTTTQPSHSLDLSRRRLLHSAAFLAGAAGALGVLGSPAGARAGPSIDPKSVAYQATPKGPDRCDNCLQWQSPNACKVVSGPIAPTGWCSIYAHKS